MKRNIILTLWLLIGNLTISFAQIPIYYSASNGSSSVYSGTYHRKTDQYERGSLSVSTSGPISYTISPMEFSIGPNEEKTWTGQIKPTPIPAGTSAEGSVDLTYEYDYDKWSGSSNDPQIEHITGSESRSFILYSLKASLPDTICIDRQSLNGTATATVFPDNGEATYKWTFQGTGVSITESGKSASFTLADDKASGIVTLEFAIQGVSYTTTAYVKACEGCQCKPITTGATFGPIAATFSVNPTDPQSDQSKYCAYSASNASFNLTLGDANYTRNLAISGATISFKKHCETGEFKDVTIAWSGEQAVADIGWLSLKATALSLTVAANGDLAGSVTLNASLNDDKNIKDLIFIKKGINGNVTFNFQGGNSFNGAFNFGGVQNINLELRKAGTVLAKFENGSLNTAGDLTGSLTGIPDVNYNAANFKLTLKNLNANFTTGLTTPFKLNSGSGTLEVKDITGIKGTFSLSLSISDDQATATATASGVSAFGMTVSNLSASVDFSLSTFEVSMIRGSLKAKHADFNVDLDVPEVRIENGELTRFVIANASVKYKFFEFALSNSSYVKPDLTITAEVKVDASGTAASLKVSEFKIDGDGKITVGTIEGNFDRNPVAIKFKATFTNTATQTGFKGDFTGKFTTIDVKGAVDIGAMTSYTYGFLKLEMGGMKIPLGNSGLQLTRIGGQIGMNYDVTINDPVGPKQGNYLIGMKLGVGDVADLVEVTGESLLQFGNNVQIGLAGDVTILKRYPMLSGRLAVNYTIPQASLTGSFGTEIKIPSDGSIFKSKNLNVNFSIANNQWSVSGSGMGGSFIDKLNLSDGQINLSGSLSDITSFSGSMSGKAALDLSIPVRFPSGFDNTDCRTMRNTSSSAWIGFAGDLSAKMNANLSASMDQNGICAEMQSDVDMSGSVSTYVWGFCGGWDVSTTGNLRVRVGCGQIGAVSGSVVIPLPFGYSQTVGVSLSL